MTDNRSASARNADRLQEQVVLKGRVWQVWSLIALLVVSVSVAGWQGVATMYVMAGIAAWIVFSLHLSFTAVLHELFELNDQLAGRKDEFRRLMRDVRDTRDDSVS